MRTLLLLAALGLAVPASADTPRSDPPPPVVVKGAYAFDWTTKFPPPKCAPVTGALLTRLKAFTCVAPDGRTGTASGKPLLAECSSKKSKSVYLVFKLLADCKLEREIQISNGAAG